MPVLESGANQMLQCKDCEYGGQQADGSVQLRCDPFATIKEPECLVKWQLIQLNVIAESHRATLDMYRKFAPMQEKMLRHMEHEIDEASEADKWTYDEEDEEEDFR
jgi:hypothetical protein